MLKKLYRFICGYVQLKVSGGQVERLINCSLQQGIELWNITQLDDGYYINIKLSDFKQIQEVVEHVECEVDIINRRGVPVLAAKLLDRRALIIGIAFLLVVVFSLSQFVLLIEIKGGEEVNSTVIKETLAEYEIKPGVLKSSIPLAKLEKLLRQKKQLSWVHAYFQGVKLVVEIKEKEVIEEINSCDVVAAKSGIITEIIVMKGTPKVEAGMTVKQGEVLISRYVPINDEGEEETPAEKNQPKEYRKVKAEGIVRARVWYKGYGETKLVKYYQQPTGNSQRSLILKYKEQEIILGGPRVSPYAHFRIEEKVKSLPEWRNYSLPVEIITRRYIQVREVKAKRSLKQAKKLSKRKALDNILQRLAKEPIILNSKFKLIKINQAEKLVRMKAVIEVKEDIAIRRE